jgi:putative ABC transport system ATP-binding protein
MITLEGVSRSYASPAGTFPALVGVDLEVARGAFVAVVGRSGSGKSTLLHLVGGIDRPTAGRVVAAGADLAALDAEGLARWRGRNVGVVFQSFQLLPTLTVLENVLLPMDFLGAVAGRERPLRARALLDRLGVLDQSDKLPAQLSGGQQQRVAIARALANDPPLVLADEPTGNHDSATSAAVRELLAALVLEGKTVVVATHDQDIAARAGRRVTLADGRIVA